MRPVAGPKLRVDWFGIDRDGVRRHATGEVAYERLSDVAGGVGRVQIESQAGGFDNKGLETQIDSRIARRGVDQFGVPRAGNPEYEFLETGALHALSDFADELVSGFGVDASKVRPVGREAETKRRQDAKFNMLSRGDACSAQDRCAHHFFSIERKSQSVVDDAIDRQHDNGLFVGFGPTRKRSGRVVGPSGGGVLVGESRERKCGLGHGPWSARVCRRIDSRNR
jgi:hypothetical protein